jgi:hypothetical protein
MKLKLILLLLLLSLKLNAQTNVIAVTNITYITNGIPATNNLPFGTTNITVGGITLSPVPTADIPTSDSSLLTTVQGFFTSFTGLQTFQTNDTIEIYTGAEQVGGNNTAATLGISYNPSFTHITTNIFIGIDSETRAAGVGGTILSQNIGINAHYVYKDVEFQAFIDASYEFNRSANSSPLAAEVGVRVWKALTDHTFTGPAISWRTSTPGHGTTLAWEIGGTL